MKELIMISVTIITKNEEKKISQAVKSARLLTDDIVVIDSGSHDRTVALARELGARVTVREWSGYGQQKNFAQSQAKYDWVLNIDADEEIPAALAKEIQFKVQSCVSGTLSLKGFTLPRRTYYLGKFIRHGGWYPNRLLRLADKRISKWSEPEIHEALAVEGEVGELTNDLFHFTFDSIEEQIQTNVKYARYGSKELERRGQKASLLKLILKPAGKFCETYFLKKGFLDGLIGFIISINAAHSMFLKYAFLFEKQIQGKRK